MNYPYIKPAILALFLSLSSSLSIAQSVKKQIDNTNAKEEFARKAAKNMLTKEMDEDAFIKIRYWVYAKSWEIRGAEFYNENSLKYKANLPRFPL